MGKYLSKSEKLIAWGGLLFGLAGTIFGILAYYHSVDTNHRTSTLESRQLLFEAWDYMEGEQGAISIQTREYSTDQRKLELARRKIENAYILTPELALVHRMKSSYYSAKNDWKSSKKWANSALKLNSDDAKNHNHLGVAELMLKNYPQSERSFIQANKLDPEEQRYIRNLLLVRACMKSTPHSDGC